MTVAFAAGEAGAFSGTGLTLAVLGQSMTADLTFVRTAGGFTVTVTGLALAFGDGSATVARFAGGGTLTMDAGAVTAAPDGPGRHAHAPSFSGLASIGSSVAPVLQSPGCAGDGGVACSDSFAVGAWPWSRREPNLCA